MSIPPVTWQNAAPILTPSVKRTVPLVLSTQAHADTFAASTPSEKPPVTANQALLPLGMSALSIQKLAKLLTVNNDQPYHAGRLWNGKTYVVTQNDRLFYGWPNALQEIPVTQAMRSRCINEQTRDFTAENGLRFRIQNKNNQRTTKASIKIFGLPLPMPHFRQTASTAWD